MVKSLNIILYFNELHLLFITGGDRLDWWSHFVLSWWHSSQRATLHCLQPSRFLLTELACPFPALFKHPRHLPCGGWYFDGFGDPSHSNTIVFKSTHSCTTALLFAGAGASLRWLLFIPLRPPRQDVSGGPRILQLWYYCCCCCYCCCWCGS